MQNYIGEIRVFPYGRVPVGWLPCNGQSVPIATYTALFELIGATYGAANQTSFTLPDLRGRIMLNAGVGPVWQTFKLGEIGGQETMPLSVDQMPRHYHSFYASYVRGDQTLAPDTHNLSLAAIPEVPVISTEDIFAFSPQDKSRVNLRADSIDPTGGDIAHENRMPYLPLQVCIAWDGYWPDKPFNH